MVLTTDKYKSFVRFGLCFPFKRYDFNNDANSHNEVEDAEPRHDEVESSLCFVDGHHCREDKSEQQQENIEVLNEVSRLETDFEAGNNLRSDKDTENSIEESYKNVAKDGLENHKNVENHESKFSKEFDH